MGKSIKEMPKKRGRPATGKDPMVNLRMPPELISSVDAWGRSSGITRSEAIRRLVEQALVQHAPPRTRPKAESDKASTMARQALDGATQDDRAAPEEQERHKRRLLKGPKEFREMRNDVASSAPAGDIKKRK